MKENSRIPAEKATAADKKKVLNESLKSARGIFTGKEQGFVIIGVKTKEGFVTNGCVLGVSVVDVLGSALNMLDLSGISAIATTMVALEKYRR